MKTSKKPQQFPISLKPKPKARFKTRIFIDYPWDKIQPNTDECFLAGTFPIHKEKPELAKIRRAKIVWLEKNNKRHWKFKITSIHIKNIKNYQIEIWVWRVS